MVYPDHLKVTVTRAPPLNVLYVEVRLKELGFCCRREDSPKPRLDAPTLESGLWLPTVPSHQQVPPGEPVAPKGVFSVGDYAHNQRTGRTS